MRKKFNYFDEDDVLLPLEPEAEDKSNKQVRQKTVDKKKVTPKQVLSFILLGVLMLGKKIADLIKLLFNSSSAVTSEADEELDDQEIAHIRTIPHTIKAIIAFILMVIIAVVTMVTVVMNSANSVNNRHASFRQDASKICTEYSEKYGVANYKYMNSEYNVKGCMLTGLCVVREVDFNDDGKSELLLAYNDNDQYFQEVWGYNGDDFVKLYSYKIPQTGNMNDDIWMTIYSKGKEFFIAEHGSSDISKVYIRRLKGDEFKKKSTASYDVDKQIFKLKGKDITDSFERIRFSVLKENTASRIVDTTLDTTDSFLDKKAKKNKTNGTNSTMESAYYSLVNEYNQRYGVATFESSSKMPYISGLAGVNLIDFDGDGTDELILIYRRSVSERDEDYDGNYISIENEKYFCDIYTWNGNTTSLVYQTDSIGNLLHDKDSAYYILKQDGNRYFFCYNTFSSSEYGRVVQASSKMMRFDGERFQQEFKASYETDYGYTEYYINGEEKYKNSFIDNGGYSVPFFDGGEEFDSSKWQICFLQGEKSRETNIKTQLDKTESCIKKLNPQYNPSSIKSQLN